MKIDLLIFFLLATGLARAGETPQWVENLAFWATPELESLKNEVARIDRELPNLPIIPAVSSGTRAGFQSISRPDGQDAWVEIELVEPSPVDVVVLVPLLAKGAGGQIAGLGFPKHFILEGINPGGETVLLMDETDREFPNPGLYPVSAPCPAATILSKIRLTATGPWQSDTPPFLALAEILVLNGNRNMTMKARVWSSSSREILPTWSRSNLVDMMMPLGLPLIPGNAKIMGWHGPVASAIDEQQAVTVDLGKAMAIDEIRLVPAWLQNMGWNSHYGFPNRFKVEIALEEDFSEPITIHDRTVSSLVSPGQNLQCFAGNASKGRYVRVTATRLRDRSGDNVFALGELQAYSGHVNVAQGAHVIAIKSLEGGEWSPAGLTDGSSGGGMLLELPDWIHKLEIRRTLEQQREKAVRRRSEVFTRAEHTIVAASVSGTGGILVVASLLSWRGHRQRARDRDRHRERLARDLHDELGSNLGSIALISSFADQEDAAQMRLDLAEIERVARESADSMRDMVSLLAGKRAGVAGDWMNVMNGLSERLMRGVTLECQLPTSPLIWEPNLETRRELYLFCKEVLHNAARHGRPTHLKFHLSPTPNGLRIEIIDNGCGFNPKLVEGGQGLGNLRERAAIMRAEMTLTSSPETGTKVTLDIPRARRWTKRQNLRS
jgi:signal transduction histidine kinase